ncbi:MAG: L,D-transpeptidase family protein [Pseudomonadota bacterium]
MTLKALKTIALGAVLAGICAAPMAFAKTQKIGELKDYRAKYEDTFIHLARDHDLGFVEMRAANPGVDPWVPGRGTRLTIPTSHLLPNAKHEGVIINLPEMRVYYFDGKDSKPRTFPIGIGREGLETPRGETTVVRKTEGPTWRPTPRMRKEDPELEAIVPPGPDNPLGTHALYLGWPQYLIHGTNKPFGIGRKISSGCIRMYPEDIKEFFKLVPVGTKVTVIEQPVKLAWIDDTLYIEAHPTEEQSMIVEEMGGVPYEEVPKAEIGRLVDIIGQDYGDINWNALRKVYGVRLGYPVPVGEREPAEENEENKSGEKKVTLSKKEIKDMITAKLDGIYKAETGFAEESGEERSSFASRPVPSNAPRALNQ